MQKMVWSFKLNSEATEDENFVKEQLKSFEQLSRIGLMAAIPFVLFLLGNIAVYAPPAFIILGMACAAIAAILGFFNITRDYEVVDRLALNRKFKTIQWEAIFVASAYAMLIGIPLAAEAIANSSFVAIGVLMGVLIGGFSYGSIPKAQTLFISTFTVMLITSYLALGTMESAITAGFLFTAAVCIDWIYRLFFFNFAQRHIHSTNLKHAAETVKLLLNDYQEQSADWLWEIGEDHKIIRPSARFAGAAGREVEDLNNMPLIDLFQDSTERNMLGHSLLGGQAFRDLNVPIQVDGELRWWNLSGRLVQGTDAESKIFRGVATDITAAKRAEERVAHLAHFDSLTDLPNRALFDQSLQRSVSRLPEGQQLAVLYLDLDNFKSINDSLGHGAGDMVLKAIANRLESSIGIEDVVARLGGDEFAVSLRSIDSTDDAIATADKIIATLSKPVMIDGQPILSGVSIGVSICPDDGNTAEELIKNADLAMYDAKERGRGCSSLFKASMHTIVQDKRNLEMDLRSALRRDQLELHYQPLVNIETGEAVGYEALLRWHHPEKGLIMPNDFIPLAEETGLIVPLGEWVVRTALDEVKNWPDHLSVSVNLSPTQMRSANLIPTIVGALAASGIEPHRLELEITESVLMADSQSNVALLHKIRSLGVHIALDDFGTGYSSLNYLRSFPFDKIKIDRCFVEEVDSREDCRAIIRAVTGLASSLGMVTTAEGVERDDQLSQLKEEGCEQVQGYLFSKAIPASHIKGRIAPDNEKNKEIRADLSDISSAKAKDVQTGAQENEQAETGKRQAG